MNISKFLLTWSGAVAAALFLGACNDAAVQSPGSDPGRSSTSSITGVRALASRLSLGAAPLKDRRVERRPSWVMTNARKAPHLWVSDSMNGEVYIFTMPALKLMGTLTGFDEPQGLCTDKQSNVWIVASLAQQIYEYSKAGKLLRTIEDPLGYPGSCAVNLRTGDLAVTNVISSISPYQPGNLLIYKGAAGSPKMYALEGLFEYFFVGYDAKGNLFLDGCDTTICLEGGTFQLAELPKHGSSLQPVAISGGSIYFPAFVEWYSNGDDLLVGDQMCGGILSACVYQVAVSGSVGTIKSSTTLHNATGGTACDVVSAALTKSGGSLAGGDVELSASQCPSYTTPGTYVWKFQGGGNPIDSNLSAGQAYPVGAAITY
jgi:hypothetical protein